MTIDYPWYTVLLCLLGGLLYAGVMYALGGRGYGRRLRWLLASLRFVAVSTICFLLLAPVMRQTVHERQLPVVVVARDVSGSVAGSADSAFAPDALVRSLDGQCRVVIDSFGDATSTDMAEMLQRYRTDHISALVLATDGISNQGSNPATVAEGLPYPVHTIALGDTTPRRDAALANLQASRIASLGMRFPVELTVTAALLAGHDATLTITDGGGHTLHSQHLAYATDDYAVSIAVTLPADEAGLQRFTARLSDAGGELTLANNSITFYVDVIDTRRRIAIFANAPHPDLAALKRAIEANPNYEATIILADDAERLRTKDGDEEWSLAVMHNLPSATHTRIDYAADLPKLYVVGLQTDLPRFNSLRTGLEIVAKSNKANEVTALRREGFSLFHLDDADAAAIEAMPPLAAPFGEARLAPSVQTLFGARLATIDTRQPLVAATVAGEDGMRTAFVWGEGLWRWRVADWQANETFGHFDRLVSQLVGFTAMQQQRQRLQVMAERSYSGTPPLLRAQCYNEAYELTTQPDVSLHLKGDSTDADYLFGRDGSAYRLALPGLAPGLYRYTASTPDGLTDQGSFAVEDINIEQRRLVADHGMLRTVSAASGGQMYHPQQLAELAARLASLKPTIHTHTRYAELLRLPLVLVLLVLLLGAEWVLRKYHGQP